MQDWPLYVAFFFGLGCGLAVMAMYVHKRLGTIKESFKAVFVKAPLEVPLAPILLGFLVSATLIVMAIKVSLKKKSV